jgi:hypothetical protein
MNVKDIIEELGGPGQVSYLTGVSRTTIWVWNKKLSIPVHYWPVLIGQRLRKQNRELTLNDLYRAVIGYGAMRKRYPSKRNKEDSHEFA